MRANFKHGFYSYGARQARARARWVLREARRMVKAGVRLSAE
jgi:hypothetical protein